jgi:site-specific recombinase XerC
LDSELLLTRAWEAEGLQRKTVRWRLGLFRRAGAMDADRESVEQLLATLAHPVTQRQSLSHLRTTYRALVERDMLDRDPTLGIKPPRQPRQVPRPLSAAELSTLLAFAKEPVRSWVILAAYAGLRCCEIVRVERSDLEQTGNGWALRVNGKGGHVGLVPAHPVVVDLMQRAGPGRLWPVTAKWVSKRSAREFRAVGLTGGLHRCRHSFATRALEAAGGDLLVVRDLMRHASVATTQVYTQLLEGRPRQVVDLLV